VWRVAPVWVLRIVSIVMLTRRTARSIGGGSTAGCVTWGAAVSIIWTVVVRGSRIVLALVVSRIAVVWTAVGVDVSSTIARSHGGDWLLDVLR